MQPHTNRVLRLILPFVIILAAVVLSPGCGIFESDVPPDVIAASEGQAQVIEGMGANQKALILAYDADLRNAYRAHAKERLDAKIKSGAYDTPEKVAALVADYESNNARWNAELDKKRDEFLSICAHNVQTGKSLNDATRRYLDFLSESRAKLHEVLETINPKKPSATGADPGPTGPTTSRPTV